MQMTRRELKALFTKKTNLFNSEQTLTALKESFEIFRTSDEGVDHVNRDISILEEKIRRERIAIAEQEIHARETLKPIEDDAARIGAMLHYCEGMPWDIAAAVLRYISGNALREAAYRGMDAAKIAK